MHAPSPSDWFWIDEGQGYPLVLIHGFGASTFSWRANIGPLKKHYRVLAPDLPGHGRTLGEPGADYSLDGLVDGLRAGLLKRGVTRAAVGGNCFGGGLALLLAHRYPELVSHLVLLDPAAILTRLPLFFMPLRVPLLGRLVAASLRPWILHLGLRLAYHNWNLITPEVLEGYSPTYRNAQQRLTLWKICGQMTFMPLRQVKTILEGIEQPTALIWGIEDRILPIKQGCKFLAFRPQTRPFFLLDIGHAPQEEDPEQVNKIIIDFLGSALIN